MLEPLSESSKNAEHCFVLMKVACPQCRKESGLAFRVGDLNRRIDTSQFDYFRCPACGVIFLWPLPENIGKYYPGDYYPVPSSLEDFKAIAEPERYKTELLQRFAGRGRLLEIGPAYGCFSYHAKEAGFDVVALEMDKSCCQFMSDVLGIHVIQGLDIEAELSRAGTFDVVAMWQVVEHLPNPWAVLSSVAQHLNPGGVLIVAAPNPNAFQFRILGRLWTHIDAPRHLELIPSRALLDFLAPLGVTPLLVTTTDPGSLGWNTFGWAESFANLSGSPYMRNALRVLGILVSKALAPYEKIEGRGSSYTAVLQKASPA